MSLYQRAKELREKRKKLSEEARELLVAPGESMSSESEERFDKIHTEIETLSSDLDRVERQMDRDAAIAESEARSLESRGVPAGRSDSDPADPESERGSLPSAEERREARQAFYRGGLGGLSPEHRSILSIGRSTADELPQEIRAQMAGDDSTGGVLIPSEDMQPLVEAKKEYGAVERARVTKIRTSHGRDIPIPTSDDTSNEGELIGESHETDDTKVKFKAVRLHAYTYSSKPVFVSRDLLRDTEFDLEGFLFKAFGERLSRVTNRHYTSYTDASGPQGVVPGSKVGVTAASQTVITWEELVDLEHSVDASYRMNAEWMFPDPVIREFKKMKDADGRPLWIPGIAVKGPDTILGYRYVINNHMDPATAGKSPVLFGDFSAYMIRDVVPPLVARLNEIAALKQQVVFVMFEAHDGRIVDAGTHPIQRLKMAA